MAVKTPVVITIFGASGDLTRRKLLPALYNLCLDRHMPERFLILGVARRGDRDGFCRDIEAALATHSRRGKPDPQQWGAFAAQVDYLCGGFDEEATYAALAARIAEAEQDFGAPAARVFYLSTPPDVFGLVAARLGASGLGRERGRDRIVVEKPFGRDLAGATALDRALREVFDESQIYRIDHYLGKETVQNIMVLRFANSMFEPLWNRKYIDHVQITAAEEVGVGTRGAFYESTGVLRDIVQNHLLEVLALVAMEPPNTGHADDVRGEKLQVLRALRVPWADTVPGDVVLGQYQGYCGEPDVAADSRTPTFAALRVFIDNWRWQGVPFYLRAGKRMARRVTEVSVHLQDIPLSLFGRGDLCEHVEPNVLTLRIQPEEGITLSFSAKLPGHDFTVTPVAMDMKYTEAFGGEPPEAYERLLLDAMRGDPTLFSRRDAVETSWNWIQPILDWADSGAGGAPLPYAPGSWGPEAADRLIHHDRRRWRNP